MIFILLYNSELNALFHTFTTIRKRRGREKRCGFTSCEERRSKNEAHIFVNIQFSHLSYSIVYRQRCEILKINPRLRATLMCSIFLIFHSQITLQYMMQCLCFSFIYVRKKRESTTSYIFVNIESFVIYVNDPVFPQKGNIPASANLSHRPAIHS